MKYYLNNENGCSAIPIIAGGNRVVFQLLLEDYVFNTIKGYTSEINLQGLEDVITMSL